MQRSHFIAHWLAFIAAAMRVFSHALPKLFPLLMDRQLGYVRGAAVCIGMPLFFVLSA